MIQPKKISFEVLHQFVQFSKNKEANNLCQGILNAAQNRKTQHKNQFGVHCAFIVCDVFRQLDFIEFEKSSIHRRICLCVMIAVKD